MLFAEFLTAVLFVALFGIAFRRTGPWPGFGWFFLIVLLGAWAVATWAEPVGPVLYGVSWIPFFFGAFILGIVALLRGAHKPGGGNRPACPGALGPVY